MPNTSACQWAELMGSTAKAFPNFSPGFERRCNFVKLAFDGVAALTVTTSVNKTHARICRTFEASRTHLMINLQYSRRRTQC
jgi:hypothetical protein